MCSTHPEDEVLQNHNSQDLSTTMNMENRISVIAMAKTARVYIQASRPQQSLGQRTRQLIGGLAAGLSLSLLAAGKAEAATFTFTTIADTTETFNDILSEPLNPGSSGPSINNEGTVAFAASLSPQSFGIFTGSGGTTTTIAQLPGILYNPVINDSDTVVYGERRSAERAFSFLNVQSSDGTFTTIDSRRDRIFTTYSPDINNAGTVAFSATTQGVPGPGAPFVFFQDISISNGNSTTIIASTTDPFFSTLGNPNLNESGTVVFSADLDAGGSGIFTSSGDEIATLLDTSGLFSSFGDTAINNSNTIAFSADLDAGGSGIFTNSGGTITPIADTSGLFSSFGDEGVAINNSGTIAFLANLDAGGSGIFTGLDPVLDKVIATGDTLFGSTVTSLAFSTTGLNDLVQIAFYATLADGTEGIFRADLVSEHPPQPVPEPASMLGLLVSAALGVTSVRQRQNKDQSQGDSSTGC